MKAMNSSRDMLPDPSASTLRKACWILLKFVSMFSTLHTFINSLSSIVPLWSMSYKWNVEVSLEMRRSRMVRASLSSNFEARDRPAMGEEGEAAEVSGRREEDTVNEEDEDEVEEEGECGAAVELAPPLGTATVIISFVNACPC